VFAAFFREQLLSKPSSVSEAAIFAYYEAFNEPAARTSVHETLRRGLDVRPLAARAGSLRLPTLVAWGSADRIVPADTGRRLARAIEDSRLEMLDAGHAPQEERPQELADVMQRFLAERS
jgi:pimeloyl-ACP methyl ester carboxylesterase